MNINNPVNSVHELFQCLLKGINPIYVTNNFYCKKYDNPEKKQYGSLLAETIQIAYAYGCNFIKVGGNNNE